MYESDFISSLHQLPTVGVKPSVNTKLHTEFVLQIWKQQENSAMLLACNEQPHKKKTQQNRLRHTENDSSEKH